MVGIGITDATPGAVRGLHLVVTDIEAAHAELTGRGVDGHRDPPHDAERLRRRRRPAHTDYNSFADFADPDGNTFVLQEHGHDSGA